MRRFVLPHDSKSLFPWGRGIPQTFPFARPPYFLPSRWKTRDLENLSSGVERSAVASGQGLAGESHSITTRRLRPDSLDDEWTPLVQLSFPRGLGWQRDQPDGRDLTTTSAGARELLRLCSPLGDVPDSVDLSEYFPCVHDQGTLPTSSACAVVGLVQYFLRRAQGQVRKPSRLFLHQVASRARDDAGMLVGVGLRDVLKSLARCGVPPESKWPYDSTHAQRDPTDPYLFSFWESYRPIRYLRVDHVWDAPGDTLKRVRCFVAAGLPILLGFSVPSSITGTPDVLFRPDRDSVLGGQAVVVAGYDDRRRIGGEQGAFMIRSSWGTEWGNSGYGWLPYAFVENRLAVDFWTMLNASWLESDEFKHPPDVLPSLRPTRSATNPPATNPGADDTSPELP